MNNQHKLIKGYRDLPQETIDLMNKVKEKERELLALYQEVHTAIDIQQRSYGADSVEWQRLAAAQPYRWLAIARTDIETGFMAMVRAIAQPLNL
jgi:hypothetical protein